MKTLPSWPLVSVVAFPTGQGIVRVDNEHHRVQATSLELARTEALAYVAEHVARRHGRAVRVDAHDPQGYCQLTVTPEGAVRLSDDAFGLTTPTPPTPSTPPTSPTPSASVDGVDPVADEARLPRQLRWADRGQVARVGGTTLLAATVIAAGVAASGHVPRRQSDIALTAASPTAGPTPAAAPVRATLQIEANGPVKATLSIDDQGQAAVVTSEPTVSEAQPTVATPSQSAAPSTTTPARASASTATPTVSVEAAPAPTSTPSATAAEPATAATSQSTGSATSTAPTSSASPTSPTSEPNLADVDEAELDAAIDAMTQAGINADAATPTTPATATATTAPSAARSASSSATPTASSRTSTVTPSTSSAPKTAQPTSQPTATQRASTPAATSSPTPTASPTSTSDTREQQPAPVPVPDDEAQVAQGDQQDSASSATAPSAEEQTRTATPESVTATSTSQTATGGGGWLSGASGDGASDGELGAWRGKPVQIGGTWADQGDNQTELWSIADGGEWAGFDGALDIAPGGLMGGESWSAAASGAYDDRWRESLINMAGLRAGKGTTYIRPFHEFNLGGWDWSVQPGDAEDFKTAWARYRAIQREVFPEAQLVYGVNVTSSGTDLDWRTTWPGKGNADVLGVDTYNGWPTITSVEQFNEQADARGDGGIPIGLNAYSEQAAEWGVPLAVPEWSGRAEMGDEPAYVEGMTQWFAKNAGTGPGQLEYEIVFNAPQDDNNFKLYGDTRMPESSAAYQQAYSDGVASGEGASTAAAPEAAADAVQGADERRGDDAQQDQQDQGKGQDEAADTSSASAAELAEGSDGADDAGETSEPT